MGLKLFQAYTPDPTCEPISHDAGVPPANAPISTFASTGEDNYEDEPVDPDYLRTQILDLQTTYDNLNALLRSRSTLRRPGGNGPTRPPGPTHAEIVSSAVEHLLRMDDRYNMGMFSSFESRPEPLVNEPPSPHDSFLSDSAHHGQQPFDDGTEGTATSAHEE